MKKNNEILTEYMFYYRPCTEVTCVNEPTLDDAITNYKIVCIDVDGIPASGSENCDDKKDICPFGYGVRVDGKIIGGARSEEWYEKDFYGKDESEQ